MLSLLSAGAQNPKRYGRIIYLNFLYEMRMKTEQNNILRGCTRFSLAQAIVRPNSNDYSVNDKLIQQKSNTS